MLEKHFQDMRLLVEYPSEISAMVNFHLKCFPNRWRIESGKFPILKDFHDSKKVDREVTSSLKIAKSSPEVNSLVEEPLEEAGCRS